MTRSFVHHQLEGKLVVVCCIAKQVGIKLVEDAGGGVGCCCCCCVGGGDRYRPVVEVGVRGIRIASVISVVLFHRLFLLLLLLLLLLQQQ